MPVVFKFVDFDGTQIEPYRKSLNEESKSSKYELADFFLRKDKNNFIHNADPKINDGT